MKRCRVRSLHKNFSFQDKPNASFATALGAGIDDT